MRPELVQAAKLLRTADPEFVDEAIRLLQGTVFSFSMKVCGHPEDAEDTMQEVLVRSLPHLARIEDPKALAVWLYKVTRNRCWRMRRKPVDAPRQTLSLDELMPDDGELGLLLKAPAADPESALLSGEQESLVHKAVLSIPPRYRIIFVLHDMEDLDTAQIAQVLDIKQGTVRVRLHRARLCMRKAMHTLREHFSEPPIPSKTKHSPRRRVSAHPDRPRGCRELFANLSEYLDGKITGQSCEEMRQHIDACPSCIAFIRDLRQAIDRCRQLDPKCNQEVAPRLRSLLKNEYARMLARPALK